MYASSHFDTAQQAALRELVRASWPLTGPSSDFSRASSACSADAALYRREICRMATIQGDSNVRQCIVRMKQVLVDLERYAAGCTSLCSPIRRIPIELLLQIFSLVACPIPQLSYIDSTRNLRHCSQVVCVTSPECSCLVDALQVCHGWYFLIAGSPSLWRHIDLNLSQFCIKERQLFAAYLRRSGTVPLRIGLRATEKTAHNEFLSAPLCLLFEQVHRWELVDLRLPLSVISHYFKDCTKPLPLLRNLSIISSSSFVSLPHTQPFPVQGFQNAVNLETAAFSSSARLALPWKAEKLRQVTSYVSAGEELQYALATLSLCSTWTTFILHLDKFTPLSAVAPITSMVSKFEIRCRDANESVLATALQSATLPSLVRLGIVAPAACIPITEFLAFISRCGLSNSLQTLCLKLRICDSQLLHCLKQLGHLTCLWVHDIQQRGRRQEHVVVTDYLLNGIGDMVKRGHLRLMSLDLTTVKKYTDANLTGLAVILQGATIRIHRATE
ncbi:hypothetical protein R3P38DRAFT_3600873 [Favolaschia claudopus]|uniref:F-box domain-containing protein n=1 Tax=Favolaschia claudopus TaxID=2862362 RepID=A0AAW0ADU6_9AGAR